MCTGESPQPGYLHRSKCNTLYAIKPCCYWPLCSFTNCPYCLCFSAIIHNLYIHCLFTINIVIDYWLCGKLKTLDTFGRCQRPLFSFGVSQQTVNTMHTITNMLNWSSTSLCERVMKKKHSCCISCVISSCKRILREKKQPLLHRFVCFQMPGKGFTLFPD